MSNVKIIPLGGVREQGKSLYVVEVDSAIYILDCGLVYPEEELLGIDAVIPDFTYLVERKDDIVGIFLTHGHDDAIGALPYLLEVIDAPVFGTELTIELARIQTRNYGLKDRLDQFYTIDADNEIEFPSATVSFFRTTHTIPDSIGIVVQTDAGSVVYTGDFKFDPSAADGYKTNFGRLTDIGDAGVLALLSDSADAENNLPSIGDNKIVMNMVEVFLNHPGRVIVASIASNLSRIQQLFHAALESERKVFLADDKMIEIADIALKLNKLTIPSRDVIGQLKDIDKYDDDQILVLETGNVGEPIKSIQSMAGNRHPSVNLKKGDLVYFATTPSIAMETTMAKTSDMIYRVGGTVRTINDKYKFSGHANSHDLRLLISFMQPRYLIPVNGESRQLFAHMNIAEEMGFDENRIFVPKIGDVIEYSNQVMKITGEVPAGDVLIDGIGVGDIGNVVLRDRRILSEDGIFVVVATISRRLGKVLVGPQITSRGFVYMKTSIDLIQACSDMTLDILEANLDKKDDFDWGELKGELREKLGKYLFKETKRRPVVLPIIMEASGYQPDNKG